MKPLWVLAIFLLGAFPAVGKDLVWVRFEAQYTYQDVKHTCSNHGLVTSVYFSAEVEGGQVTRAYLQKSPSWPLSSRLQLRPSEMADLKLFRDKGGRYWVEELSLSPWLAYWVMSNTSFGVLPCLTQPFDSLASPLSYVFDLEDIELGVQVVLSPRLEFEGNLKDGGIFRARMVMNQRQYKGPER